MIRATPLLALSLLAASAAGAASLPDNPLDGRFVFENKRCHACHGVASGEHAIAPRLAESNFDGSFLDLGAALWNHVPGMSVSLEASGLPWPQLSEREAASLVAFLYFIDYLGRPGDPQAGAETFSARGCSGCHSVGGEDRGVGPDLADLTRFPSPLFVAQATWNHGPAMFATMQRRGIEPPSFEEGDLADLSAYIRQKAPPGPRERVLLAPGNPNTGRKLFAAKGCATCHGGEARGGREGPDLGTLDLHRSADGIAGTMWNHALAMSSTMRERGIDWPSLTTPELADLVSFLYFLRYADTGGDAEVGAGVFVDQGCASCHSDPDAPHAGPELAAAASPAALVAEMWNHASLMQRAILAEGRPWPELTGEELRHLFAYLSESE
jgi:cytochrome c2